MRELNVSMSSSGNGDGGTELFFHAYRYFPYEKELARREVQSVTGVSNIVETPDCFRLAEPVDAEKLRSLTYVAEVITGKDHFVTFQYELEQSHRRAAGIGKRQATRYSVHGLHEYKGRFNPQVARFLLNYLGATKRTLVLDPFCGSGTTLVEAALRSIRAVGIDMNPLAAFLCNAKLCALSTPAGEIEAAFESCLRLAKRAPVRFLKLGSLPNRRMAYLQNWFPSESLAILELLRSKIGSQPPGVRSVLLSLVSDLLRDYSLQEPSDLRIRRRFAAFPTVPLLDAFEEKARSFICSLSAAQSISGLKRIRSKAIVGDSRNFLDSVKRNVLRSKCDLVITSPPYATALPYIDTQRLSLVWLGLCSPNQIRELEGDALGSRELNGTSIDWKRRAHDNSDSLPSTVASFCQELQSSITSDDGFRRQAVPALIYRYFADMKRVFASLRTVLKEGALLAFLVGANRTTLGGEYFEIDTPSFIALVAGQLGFHTREVIPLQTYHRYGLHQKNSIENERLTIFQRS